MPTRQDLLNFEGGALRNGGEENEEHERNYKWKKSNFYVLKLALNPPLSYKCFSIRAFLV